MTTRSLSPLTHDAAEPRCPERTADSRTTQSLAEVTCATCLRNMVLSLLRPEESPPCATCGLPPEHPDDREPIEPGDYHLIDTTSPARCPSCGLVPSRGSEGAARVAAARRPFVDVVCDGPPSHVSGRFVETEDPAGRGVNAGEWIDRGDGMWALRIPQAAPVPHAYAVEILWNSDSPSEHWRIETEDATTDEDRAVVERSLDDMVKFGGYRAEHVRLVAIAVAATDV